MYGYICMYVCMGFSHHLPLFRLSSGGEQQQQLGVFEPDRVSVPYGEAHDTLTPLRTMYVCIYIVNVCIECMY